MRLSIAVSASQTYPFAVANPSSSVVVTQVAGSAPPSHCSVSESESRSGGIQRLSPAAADVGQPRRRPPPTGSELVSSPGNNAARTRPKTSCCCYRCCFCWRCQCNGSVMLCFTPYLLFCSQQKARKRIVVETDGGCVVCRCQKRKLLVFKIKVSSIFVPHLST